SENGSLRREKYCRRALKWLTAHAEWGKGGPAHRPGGTERTDRGSAGDFGAAARVIPPGHSDRYGIENDEEHQRGIRRTGQFKGRAEAFWDEKSPIGAHGAAEPQHGGGFLGALGFGHFVAARPAIGMPALGQRVE